VADDCGLSEDECFVGLREIVGSADADTYERDGYMHDPLKLVVSFKTPEACKKFKDQLRGLKIQWEKSTPVTILFLVSMGTVEDHFEHLYRAILQVKDSIGFPECDAFDSSVAAAVNGQATVMPRDAALCDGELMELDKTEGRISSQLLVPYPPGIPVFLPGLTITRPMIDIVQAVADTEGPDAVHGLFVRGKKYFIEVIRHDEEDKIQWLTGRPPPAEAPPSL
jgi:arginine decarboxylase